MSARNKGEGMREERNRGEEQGEMPSRKNSSHDIYIQCLEDSGASQLSRRCRVINSVF